MKKYVLCAALAAILPVAAQAQSELDELLKKQDARPATTGSPGVPSTGTPAVGAPPPTPQGNNPAPAGPGWMRYINQRFGFALEYPAEAVPGQSAADGSGAEFHNADKFSVVARGQYLRTADPDDSLTKRWESELQALGSTVKYKRKTETWYVISGTSQAGTEYYHKFFVQGGNWSDFHVVYPHANAQKYDKWVEQIGKRFVPFLDGPFDRLK